MEKKLKTYHTFIQKASAHPTPELRKHHAQMLQQFQHERLIHLIVTMFFALFLIISFIATTILYLALPSTGWGSLLTYSATAITLIFFVVTLFYIRHYYQLENGVQQLEDFTAKLFHQK